MAALTTFTEQSLKRYLVMFGKGELSTCEPVASGIENSNYFVTLDDGSGPVAYVLTIIEQFDFEEAPFFNKLVSHLFQHGLPVAAPQSTLDGKKCLLLFFAVSPLSCSPDSKGVTR